MARKRKALLADGDPRSRACPRGGHISNSLQALIQALPAYSNHDFVIANRKTAKGLWRSELYTNRDFEPQDILFGP